MPARIFISHSSNDEAKAGEAFYEHQLVDALYEDLTAKNFEVLLDRTNLRPGDGWRDIINGWLGGCDAAIILLSSKALKSAWVGYELSVVSFRRRGGSFRVIPILLSPEPASDWKVSDPTQLFENQIILAAWTDAFEPPAALQQQIGAVVTQAASGLAGLQAADEYPVDRAVLRAEEILGHVQSRPVLDKHIRDLRPCLGDWQHDLEPARKLARCLVTLGLTRARPALRDLSSHLRKDLGHHEELLDLLATTWVSQETVDAFERSISTSRTVATARSEETARLFAWARLRDLPSNGWKVQSASWTSGARSEEAQKAALIAEVEQALQAATGRSTEAQAKKRVANWAESGRRVFIALPRKGLTKALIEELRRRFADVGFFFLSCDAERDRPFLDDAQVVVIPSPLEEHEEELYVGAWLDARDDLID